MDAGLPAEDGPARWRWTQWRWTRRRWTRRGSVRWRSTAADVGLIVLVWWVSFVGPDVDGPTGLDVLLTGVASAGILLRHRAPVLTLLLCTGADLAATLSGLQGFGYHFAAWVAVYTFSTRFRMAWALLGTAPTMGAVLVAESAEKDWQWSTFGMTLLAGGTLVALSFGQVVRVREQLVTAMQERAESAARTQESEAAARIADHRLRTAREVHDIVAHRMAIIHLRASVSLRTEPDMSPAGRTALEEIDEAATAALAEIDQLLADLRAGDGADRAAATAALDLDDIVAEFRGHGMDVVLACEGDPSAVAEPVARVVRSAALEGLTNGLKHGGGATVRLSLRVTEEQVELVMRNRSDERPVEVRTGWGLRGVRERAEQLGGEAWFGPEDGDFVLGVSVPAGGAP